jgi:hypothetical protein
VNKKAVKWLVAAFVVFYLLSSPEDAAGMVRDAAGGVQQAAESLSLFVSALS